MTTLSKSTLCAGVIVPLQIHCVQGENSTRPHRQHIFTYMYMHKVELNLDLFSKILKYIYTEVIIWLLEEMQVISTQHSVYPKVESGDSSHVIVSKKVLQNPRSLILWSFLVMFLEERKYLFTFVLLVCPHVCICTTCKPGANRAHKGESEPLELEL